MRLVKQSLIRQQILDEPSKANDTAVYVVELGTEIAGFGACCAQRTASLAADGYGGEISALYILRACQGRGFGRELMNAMAANLSGRGHLGASVWVLRDNFRARRFYESLQGALVAERQDVRGAITLMEVAYGWRLIHPRRLSGTKARRSSRHSAARNGGP
ncbi:MAG TPA: GNAT family N-acetyltransferase [Xanthobacteraceae bacterium]|nr:GNAT family N-acetyltransferase [Xanthobacteraceae bacterium]